MAQVYWLSFRIKDDAGYDETYTALIEALKDVVDQTTWWCETTSFFIFSSDLGTDELARHIKAAIRPNRDLVVLGIRDYKGGRVIGHCEDLDIFKLMPLMKKA